MKVKRPDMTVLKNKLVVIPIDEIVLQRRKKNEKDKDRNNKA
jgi:hypothetical protein